MSEPSHSRTILAVEWADGVAQLRVRDDGADASVLVPVVGASLRYRTDGEVRRCIGHRAQGIGYVDCSSKANDGSKVCTACAVAEARHASQLHHAHTEPSRVTDSSMAEHLAQPTVLYLAAFRDGSVKVGTSTTARHHVRLLEQGAWLARLVADADDGYAVRQAEDHVTGELFVPQSVSASRKLRGLTGPVDDRELADRLDALTSRVHELLGVRRDARVVTTSKEWRNPAADHPDIGRARAYPQQPTKGSHSFEIVAAVGKQAIVIRPGADDIFAIDLSRMIGLSLEWGDFALDELLMQDSLF